MPFLGRCSNEEDGVSRERVKDSVMVSNADLSGTERLISDAIASGVHVDMREGDPQRDIPAKGPTWGAGRTVHARLLIELLTRERLPEEPRPRALRLTGCRVAGSLDLRTSTLVCPLELDECFFDVPVLLEGARAPGISLQRCFLPAVRADHLESGGHLDLQRLTADVVSLARAQIGGQLDLSGARLTGNDGLSLAADGARVANDLLCGDGFTADGELRLSGATIGGRLDLSGAVVVGHSGAAVCAEGIQVGGDLLGRGGFRANGHVRLVGALIGGALNLSGAQLVSGGWGEVALSAEEARVDRGVFCDDGFSAEGEVRLAGAQIGGHLSLRNASLSTPEGWALTAEGIRVEQHMLLNEGRYVGELQLSRAEIGGYLDLSHARASNSGGRAFVAERLRIGQDLLSREFFAEGDVALGGAQIRGFADLSKARLSNAEGCALDLRRAEAGELSLPEEWGSDGVVDLTGAQVGQFQDGWLATPSQDADAPLRYRPRLAGFVYESLAPGSDQVSARLDWLAHAEEGYLPPAYDRLTAEFQKVGRDEDAHRVVAAKQRRRRATLSPPARTWNYLLSSAVGYGYKPWRAALWLLSLVLVGLVVFGWAWPEHMHATKKPEELPAFNAAFYALDAVLPIVNLGQEQAWSPTGAAQWWYVASVLGGWALVTLTVAALGVIFVRD